MSEQSPRRVIETHHHQAYDDVTQELVTIEVTALEFGHGVDPMVTVGRYAFSAEAAALLAESLLTLAEAADPGYRERLKTNSAWDLGELQSDIRRHQEESDG